MVKEAQDIQILNVRLPDDILSWLDSLVKKNIYSNRSEAVREFIRDYVKSNREITTEAKK